MKHTNVNDIERYWHSDLYGLGIGFPESLCESCNGNIRMHMWADLDVNGVAVWCSVSEWHKLHPGH